MQRRKFSRKFKFEAVKLVRERGASVAQAARDLDLHENVLRNWVRDHEADPGSAARARRRGLPRHDGQRSIIADDVLDRQFIADAPNRKWVADFTYIWTAEGWLCVAAVIDLFSRRVVGWSMSDTMTAPLVADALLMADNGVTCSMSRSGNIWDNAAMESFFSSLKTERIARRTYRTRNQARAEVFDYIERFYNPTRRRSTMGYLSPKDFERRANAA